MYVALTRTAPSIILFLSTLFGLLPIIRFVMTYDHLFPTFATRGSIAVQTGGHAYLHGGVLCL